MWRNYLTVAVRALAKSRAYSIINVAGLAIGMTACLMILLFIRYETSYDRWLPNAENVYQLQTFYVDRQTGETLDMQMASYVAGARLKKDFPQIERMVYASSGGFTVLRDGEAVAVERGSQVDGNLFDVLRLPLARGDARTALRDPGSVALSETQARTLFGSADPMGRTLTVMLRGRAVDHRVTAVMRDLPKNSHQRFNMIVRYDPVSYFAEQPDFLTSWGWQSGWWYLTLRPGTDPAAIHAGLAAWEKRNIPDETFGDRTYNAGDEQDYRLANVRDIHLGQAQNGAATPGNDRRTIVTFGIVAALILAMACVNFTNLSTARASQRAREVALRKVLGANRRQLVAQFLGESILLAAVAMLVSLALLELLMPRFARFLDADITFSYLGADGLLLPIVLLVVLVGAASGLYPAFYLSRFQPAQVLKANRSSADAAGTGRLRNALVVGQFAVSIGLIICTAIVYAQTVHARTADPGYRRSGLLQIEGIGRRQLVPLSETLTREIERIPGVKSVGRTNIGIATSNSMNTGVQVPGQAEAVNIGWYAIDPGFLPTMGVRFVAGRNFDPARPMDDATLPVPDDAAATAALNRRGANVIVNELAARRMGYPDPATAVGKSIKVGAFDADTNGLTTLNIIGVVQDSRFRSIREPIDPIIFRLNRNGYDQMLVRYDAADPQRLRDAAERVWKRIARDAPFSAEFSDEIVRELYEGEEARATIFAGFALLAVVIGCLGLYGLAAFTAERRTKEIGIRKVLGARVRDIVRLLAWQFSKPVVVANLIAWPIAWWVMRDWLNTFDQRVAMTPTPFVIAGLIALFIAIATVAGHALRIARLSPIHALRYE